MTQRTIWYFIFAQAFIAMLGSLYYGFFGDPVVNIINGTYFSGMPLGPCTLCWYSRILMYPIVVISAVGIVTKYKRFTDFILPLSLLGIALDAYHYALQKLPIKTAYECTSAVPCNALQVDYFGFITIPFLALTAFVVITILCVVNMQMNKVK